MFHSQNHAVVHKESATGQEIVAENTANAPLELRIYGASRQEQNAEPASPSPDYPSEIVSAVDFEVGSVGRNLLDPAWGNLTSQTLSGITMTRQNDLLVLDGTCTYGNSYFVFGSMNPPYLGYPYTLKAGKTYRLSKTVVSGTAENNQNFEVVISASDLDGSNRASHGLRAESRTLGPYDVDKRINFLRFDVYKGAILSDYTLAVQLEEGETATAYTPYRGNIATINQPLRGIPDGSGGWIARDCIEVKDGAVRLVRECGETAFDGTEEWHDYIATFDTVSHRLLHKDLAPALCTHGRYGGRYKGIFFGWASVNDIGFYPSRIGVDSVAGWQAWLAAQNTAGTPVKVVYALETPQITDITTTDLGGALLSMKSVQYYTRIYHTSPLPVELEAAVTKLGSDHDILGVQVDFENNRYERLAAAKCRSGGSDFNRFAMYGGRRRCNLADDGTVLAYYGDDTYAEDGSNGQVMVEQPKFYYRVEPLLLDNINGGKGSHLRKANYYISQRPREGFKLHPAFVRDGVEKDRIYLSAFEGCLWDADGGETGTGYYILDDAQVADWETDKLSSIAGAKPMSGLTQLATRANMRKAAVNRGPGWSMMYMATLSASQLLMLVEYASFNMRGNIGAGISYKADDKETNCSETTGQSSQLGNQSGVGTNAVVSYRGEENLWGNIWNMVDGINLYCYGIGNVYVADHGFADWTADGYQEANFTVAKTNGKATAFGYTPECDWLFLASETAESGGTGESYGVYMDYQGWLGMMQGGMWHYGPTNGAYYAYLNLPRTGHNRAYGARLAFVPV